MVLIAVRTVWIIAAGTDNCVDSMANRGEGTENRVHSMDNRSKGTDNRVHSKDNRGSEERHGELSGPAGTGRRGRGGTCTIWSTSSDRTASARSPPPPSPGADVAEVSPVPVQMWRRCADPDAAAVSLSSQLPCGRGECAKPLRSRGREESRPTQPMAHASSPEGQSLSACVCVRKRQSARARACASCRVCACARAAHAPSRVWCECTGAVPTERSSSSRCTGRWRTYYAALLLTHAPRSSAPRNANRNGTEYSQDTPRWRLAPRSSHHAHCAGALLAQCSDGQCSANIYVQLDGGDTTTVSPRRGSGARTSLKPRAGRARSCPSPLATSR
jgi:hypothetical protein